MRGSWMNEHVLCFFEMTWAKVLFCYLIEHINRSPESFEHLKGKGFINIFYIASWRQI